MAIAGPDDIQEARSIFDAAGGMPAFVALALANHERCLADPVLNHPFSHGGHPAHIERLASYWAEVFGGPPLYSETCGGEPHMLAIHAESGAEDSMGPRFVDCFTNAIADAGFPDDARLRGAMRAYIEWAAARVMSYAPIGAVVPTGTPVPRWTWDGLDPT